MSDLTQFIASIPTVTRFFTISALTTKFLNTLNIVPYGSVICYSPLIFNYKPQIWRLFTGLIVTNPQPMQGCMDIYMLYSYSRGIENHKFFNNSADFLYYFVIVLPIIWALNSFNGSVWLLNSSLIGALTYTWSRSNKDQKVNIYFLPIKASLLPIVTLGFRLLLEGVHSFACVLIGMVSAYIYSCFETQSLGPLYYYLKDLFPRAAPTSLTNKNNRTGVIHTIKSGAHDDGYLPAPNWFKYLLGFKTTIPKSKFQTLSNSKAEGKSTGFSFRNTSSFKGKGHRLGD